MKIAFIGAGNMAEALIARLKSHYLIAADIDAKRLNYIGKKYRIRTAECNSAACRFGDVIVLAVKPQQLGEVLGAVQGKKLIVSIAAGVPLRYLEKKLPGARVVRAMPNNPCMAGAGMTALAKGRRATLRDLQVAERIFKAVGEVMAVPEKWMDAVTGLSGSGPAFAYLVIEALTSGGIRAGLPKKVAEKLALQTVIGAAETVKMTGIPPRKLRAMVSSPGGTTIEGLAVIEKYMTSRALSLAVRAAAKKSRLLGRRWAF
jgi:pyrroline-5-carboxylate reductase